MHMSDALLSPKVGLTMWALTASSIGWAARRLQTRTAMLNVPLMGVAGAFIFAAQMINFSIPGTGSSGHLGGGMLLAILLGPWAGYLTLASVLTIQALFFADGGLLALGCNIFNLGFFTCLLAYSFIYRPLIGTRPSSNRVFWISILACTFGLQLGSLGVVFQTTLSGLAELPAKPFALLMQPVHLAIGLMEGAVTGLLINFLRKAEPGLIVENTDSHPLRGRGLIVALFFGTLLVGGGLSLVASENPDGLEWAVERTAGKEEISSAMSPLHRIAGRIQEMFSFLPGYDFTKSETEGGGDGEFAAPLEATAETSVAGIVGSLMTLTLIIGVAVVLRLIQKRVGG